MMHTDVDPSSIHLCVSAPSSSPSPLSSRLGLTSCCVAFCVCVASCCLCRGIVQTREGRPVLDPAMSNFDTLGRGWAWGLVALAILLGKTPATTTTKTKHQTPNLLTTPMTPPPHITLCCAIATACCTMPRHAMPCYCYAMLCMEFYAKGCALTRVMCGCLCCCRCRCRCRCCCCCRCRNRCCWFCWIGFACSGWLGSVSEARRGPAPKEASLR